MSSKKLSTLLPRIWSKRRKNTQKVNSLVYKDYTLVQYEDGRKSYVSPNEKAQLLLDGKMKRELSTFRLETEKEPMSKSEETFSESESDSGYEVPISADMRPKPKSCENLTENKPEMKRNSSFPFVDTEGRFDNSWIINLPPFIAPVDTTLTYPMTRKKKRKSRKVKSDVDRSGINIINDSGKDEIDLLPEVKRDESEEDNRGENIMVENLGEKPKTRMTLLKSRFSLPSTKKKVNSDSEEDKENEPEMEWKEVSPDKNSKRFSLKFPRMSRKKKNKKESSLSSDEVESEDEEKTVGKIPEALPEDDVPKRTGFKLPRISWGGNKKKDENSKVEEDEEEEEVEVDVEEKEEEEKEEEKEKVKQIVNLSDLEEPEMKKNSKNLPKMSFVKKLKYKRKAKMAKKLENGEKELEVKQREVTDEEDEKPEVRQYETTDEEDKPEVKQYETTDEEDKPEVRQYETEDEYEIPEDTKERSRDSLKRPKLFSRKTSKNFSESDEEKPEIEIEKDEKIGKPPKEKSLPESEDRTTIELEAPLEIFPTTSGFDFLERQKEEEDLSRKKTKLFKFPRSSTEEKDRKLKHRDRKIDPNPLKKMFANKKKQDLEMKKREGSVNMEQPDVTHEGNVEEGEPEVTFRESVGEAQTEVEDHPFQDGGFGEVEACLEDGSDTESADHASTDKSSVAKLTGEKQPKKLMSGFLSSFKRGKKKEKVIENDTKITPSVEVVIKEQAEEVQVVEESKPEGIVYAELDMARAAGNGSVMRKDDDKTEYAEIIYPGSKPPTEEAKEELRKSRENLSSSRENLTEVDAVITTTEDGKKEAAV